MADRDIAAAEQEEAIKVCFCESQQDVTKAYEHVAWTLLARKVVEEGLPVMAIRLSHTCYSRVGRLQHNTTALFPTS